MRPMRSWLVIAALGLLMMLPPSELAAASRADIVGAATVLDDGSLRIGSRTVRMYGIYIAPTRQICSTFSRPVRCGGRAALALEIKIQGFVFCHSVGVYADGSVSAVCYIRRTFRSAGEDLAAYLLAEGLALALPGAPFEYFAIERIAQTRGLGLWGFPADSIIFR